MLINRSDISCGTFSELANCLVDVLALDARDLES